MKCWLSLDDLARNCQGFGLMIAVEITGKPFGRKVGDVNEDYISYYTGCLEANNSLARAAAAR